MKSNWENYPVQEYESNKHTEQCIDRNPEIIK